MVSEQYIVSAWLKGELNWIMEMLAQIHQEPASLPGEPQAERIAGEPIPNSLSSYGLLNTPNRISTFDAWAACVAIP